MLKAVLTFSPLELCDRGEYEAAAESAGLGVGQWPENDSEGNLTPAERLLVAGIITSVLGGIQQSADQAVARDMLLESVRLFGDDARAWAARSWLARVEYWAGNLDQALELADEVLAAPLDAVTKFRALLTKASVYSDRELPKEAMKALGEMAQPYESLDPLFKGQFHNQRGRVLRLIGETDRAIVEYDCAIHFFQEAGNVRCQAIAANNLAGIYLETKQYNEAHQYVDSARELFRRIGDKTYEAKALDQTALIYLAVGKFTEALEANARSLVLVDQGEIVNECLATNAKIKREIAISEKPDHAKMAGTSPTPTTAMDSGKHMEPLEMVSLLLQTQPDNAVLMLDFIIWARANRNDPRHEAELDEIEEMTYAKTPDCLSHLEEYRRSRLPTSDS